MPDEELPGMPPVAAAEAQTVTQPAESAPVLQQTPAVERAKGFKALLLSIRNALSGKKSSPAADTQASTTQEMPPAPLTPREASLPPKPPNTSTQ